MLLKKFFNQWWVRIFEYSNKMTLKYYSYLYSCYFRNTNIFGYLFGKYVAYKYIWIFIRYIMWHPNIFGYPFVSILWYSLITVLCAPQDHREEYTHKPSSWSDSFWLSYCLRSFSESSKTEPEAPVWSKVQQGVITPLYMYALSDVG